MRDGSVSVDELGSGAGADVGSSLGASSCWSVSVGVTTSWFDATDVFGEEAGETDAVELEAGEAGVSIVVVVVVSGVDSIAAETILGVAALADVSASCGPMAKIATAAAATTPATPARMGDVPRAARTELIHPLNPNRRIGISTNRYDASARRNVAAVRRTNTATGASATS